MRLQEVCIGTKTTLLDQDGMNSIGSVSFFLDSPRLLCQISTRDLFEPFSVYCRSVTRLAWSLRSTVRRSTSLLLRTRRLWFLT